MPGRTTDYYYDGASELAEYRGSGDGDRMRYTVHGVAYIDEHLMMMVDKAGTSNDRPYYYVQDRLYNVWAMIDRAGAVVEGWRGHPARGRPDARGLPLIRESAGRGDMNNDTLIDADRNRPRCTGRCTDSVQHGAKSGNGVQSVRFNRNAARFARGKT